ncbi:PEPxxWA-CTERM sorting domain-containing protein [Sphingomonas endolithica]|uniref:PEPxxWA-CTERM sorting domain-containing protein n=1 Tax=Sphingomonas endolithica TaxID=2972485 RepID=UPI0021AF6D9F|nr:PEPxxWA-CTERM sorting domain-containing protein [Sphingomonas sp. ZFBP2030]
MKKMMATALVGALTLSAAPAYAGTFLVEVGTNLGSPNGTGSGVDQPKFRVTNTTAGSDTTPYLTSLALTLDGGSIYNITNIDNFGGGSINGGTDNSPGVGTPSETLLPSKTAMLTYGATNFDPGAYSAFRVNFGTTANPSASVDFRNVLFNGANTLTGTFSDGSVGRVNFSGSTTADPASFSFNSFAATGAVPEPATWAMMIVGMGAVGFAMRRRSAVKTTVSYA